MVLVIVGGVAFGLNTSSSAAAPPHARVASSSAKKFKIVYASPLPNSADWARSAKYLKAWAKKNNASVSVVGPATTVDIPTIIADIQTAITEHPGMIVTCACEAGAFNHVLSKAKRQGIAVVTLAADSSPSSRNLFLGTNYEALGQESAKALVQKMHGNAQIGIIQMNGTVQNQVQEIDAFKGAIKSSPGMQVVADEYDNSDASTASSEISQMLIAHPNLNVIWTVEGIAPGVIEPALKAAGKKPGQITVLAIDLQPPTRQAIEDGYIWATNYQQFFDSTPLAAECGKKIWEHKRIATTDINTGSLLITKSNLPKSLPPAGEKLPTKC
jgi:ribose transport system substrate-binding protein